MKDLQEKQELLDETSMSLQSSHPAFSPSLGTCSTVQTPVNLLHYVLSMLLPYYKIARTDHWFKNIFMLPGIGAAYVLNPIAMNLFLPVFITGILSTCLAASANYSINEYLDRKFDRLHPTKRNRPCALGLVKPEYLLIEYFLLVSFSLGLATFLNLLFLGTTILLLFMGIVYNVPPIRTKDFAVLDIFSESLNNPIRFILGWALVLPAVLPPSSILLTYWFGGAFLMTVKRYAEFRQIGSKTAMQYRKSFRKYNENKLLLLSLFCALNSAFFLAIFLIKYRIELLLTFPFFALLFTWYFRIGLKKDSIAQRPEKLYREWKFVVLIVFLVLYTTSLFFIEVPWLRIFLERTIY